MNICFYKTMKIITDIGLFKKLFSFRDVSRRKEFIKYVKFYPGREKQINENNTTK